MSYWTNAYLNYCETKLVQSVTLLKKIHTTIYYSKLARTQNLISKNLINHANILWKDQYHPND